MIMKCEVKKNYRLNYFHIRKVYTPMHSSWFALSFFQFNSIQFIHVGDITVGCVKMSLRIHTGNRYTLYELQKKQITVYKFTLSESLLIYSCKVD